MQGQVDHLKGATLGEQDRSIRYTILRREVGTNRELYDALLQRFKEVSATAGVSTNNISIVDVAPMPTRPISPNLVVNVALALLAGFCIALAFVYFRENLDDVVRTVEDAERKIGGTGLGMVPRLAPGVSFREELERPASGLAEAFHAIRSAIELSQAGGAPRTLFVTSCGKGDGKTSSAFAIARDFALTGRRVLLVDADMRRPTMHKKLSTDNEVGLIDLLSRRKDIAEVKQRTQIANLDFIASGTPVPNPADLLTTDALPWLIGRLEDGYDMVLIDGPPTLGLADAPSIAAHVEATLFVINASQTSSRAIRTALRRLRLNRVVPRGFILNRVDVRSLGYGYQDYYDYDGAPKQRGWWRRT